MLNNVDQSKQRKLRYQKKEKPQRKAKEEELKQKKEYIENNIKSNNGLYNYFSKEIYKLFINPQFTLSNDPQEYENTIFFKALDFLKAMQNDTDENHILLDEHIKDPLTFLIKLVQRRKAENDYSYYARLQDSVPLILNNQFLEGSLTHGWRQV